MQAESVPNHQSSASIEVPSSSTPPIALRKGTRSCTLHPIEKVVSYSHLSQPYRTFLSTLSSVSLPSSYVQALSSPGWKHAMDEEMAALYKNNTWELTFLPPSKHLVGCRWVYAVKYHPNGTIERLKARLVAKGYTQTFSVDYFETFFPVARLSSVRILLSIAVIQGWPLFQLDIKNAFLHGDLLEEVYMEQPPGYVAQGESRMVCKLKKAIYGLKQSPRAWFDKFSAVAAQYGLR